MFCLKAKEKKIIIKTNEQNKNHIENDLEFTEFHQIFFVVLLFLRNQMCVLVDWFIEHLNQSNKMIKNIERLVFVRDMIIIQQRKD